MSEPRIVAVASVKGGVGKTTLSMALCQGWNAQGKRVLAIDLDPAGGIARSLGVGKGEYTIADLLLPRDPVPLERAVIRSPLGNIWSIPASKKLNEIGLVAPVLRTLLASTPPGIDYVLLDCQPYDPALIGPLDVADRIVLPVMLDQNSFAVSAQTALLAHDRGVLGKVAGMVAMNVHRPMSVGTRQLLEAIRRLKVVVHYDSDSVMYHSREWIDAVNGNGYKISPVQIQRAIKLTHEIVEHQPSTLAWEIFIKMFVGVEAL